MHQLIVQFIRRTTARASWRWRRSLSPGRFVKPLSGANFCPSDPVGPARPLPSRDPPAADRTPPKHTHTHPRRAYVLLHSRPLQHPLGLPPARSSSRHSLHLRPEKVINNSGQNHIINQRGVVCFCGGSGGGCYSGWRSSKLQRGCVVQCESLRANVCFSFVIPVCVCQHDELCFITNRCVCVSVCSE